MINIAIDGHAGSGKSVLARGIAERLNYRVLNTGALYRAMACAYRESGLKGVDNDKINQFIENINISVKFIDDVQHVFVNGKDYTPHLREEEISILSSEISPYQQLRDKVVDLQRDFAKYNNCVMEGRDIATNVLPNAQIKIFLTASPEKRAMRRYLEMKDKGNITFEQVLSDLKERDYRDEHRAVAPLVPAKDSIILDNGDLTLEGTIDKAIELINAKLQKK